MKSFLLSAFALLFASCTDILSGEESTSPPIILPGMPGLEWMTENLSGYGGTEINGNTYYTYDEAVEAVKQLGNGWRLPTREEVEALSELEGSGDADRKGRWFGGNHDTDHAGSLFLPASGCYVVSTGSLIHICTSGYIWSSSPYIVDGSIGYLAGHLQFYLDGAFVQACDRPSFGFTVRCVRNIDNYTSSDRPRLEWMTENLSGYGGTEVDGRWYYTWDQALVAESQLDDGWRLPTVEEFLELCGSEPTWDDERNGCWFGFNHNTGQKGRLFFPANGSLMSVDINGGSFGGFATDGGYWSSSYHGGNFVNCLIFSYIMANATHRYRTDGLSIRCVRDI